jgi:hypothetical protein
MDDAERPKPITKAEEIRAQLLLVILTACASGQMFSGCS